MNCYFCHNPISYGAVCRNHAAPVGYDIATFGKITAYFNINDVKYAFIFFLDEQKLIITYCENGLYKSTLYQGPIINNLTPENTNDVINRLLKVKAFL